MPTPTRPARSGRRTGLIGLIGLVLGVLLCCGAFDGWLLSDAGSDQSNDAASVGMVVLNLHAGRTYLVYTKGSAGGSLECDVGDGPQKHTFSVHSDNNPPLFGGTVHDSLNGTYTYFGRWVADRDGYLVVYCGDVDYYMKAHSPENLYAGGAVLLSLVFFGAGLVLVLVWSVRMARRSAEPRPIPAGRRPSWVWYPLYGAVIFGTVLVTLVVLVVYGPLFDGANESTEVGRNGAAILVDPGTRYLVYRDAASDAGIDTCTLSPPGLSQLKADRPLGVPQRITNVGTEYEYIGSFRGVAMGTTNNGQLGIRCPNSVSAVLVRPDRTPRVWVLCTLTAALLVVGLAVGLMIRVGLRRGRIPPQPTGGWPPAT